MSTPTDAQSISCHANPVYLRFKSVADRVLAAIGLIFASLPMLWLAFRIRRDGHPALFRQTRAGKDGRPFELYKFRTMRTDADPFGDSPQTGNDPRITPLGRWLRERSLDELPQLINVLRGEMSLVGPRPLYLQQMAEWNDRQRCRLLVKPGLTGYAQVHGRGSLTLEDKLEWDVRYVEAMSLRTDLWILWRTLTRGWRRQDVYEVRYSKSRRRRSDSTGEDQSGRTSAP